MRLQLWNPFGRCRTLDRIGRLGLAVFCGSQLSSHAAAFGPTNEIVLREGLFIQGVSTFARTAFRQDPIEAQIVQGTLHRPGLGESVAFPDGATRSWARAGTAEDGGFTNFNGRASGYIYCPLVLASNGVFLLKAAGHSMGYVNGEPHGGDVYNNGSMAVPVALHAGTNDFLFAAGRGRMKIRLAPPKAPLAFDLRDSTLPDSVEGNRDESWGAVLIVNSTDQPASDLSILASAPKSRTETTPVPSVPAYSTRKVGFRLPGLKAVGTNRADVMLALTERGAKRRPPLDQTTVSIRLRKQDETYRLTFLSGIDGSVQYYAVRPPSPPRRNAPPAAMVLSLHGASVEAMGQAEAYSPKSWAYIVAPTNRRPYGFDWEDWGRRDAMEVLEEAQRRFGTDPRRTYLTGHSMGGHGTWQVGVTLPDRFAALAPSAGWISFFSYAGSPRGATTNAVLELLARAMNPGDTLALSTNYLQQGIYILHGDADDNVPISEARDMRQHLAPFHHDFAWHEQKGAGHWWDESDEPGASCVDWAPLFDFFGRHQIPDDASVREVTFATMNPGVSAQCHWAVIEAQQRALKKSTISIRFDPGQRRFVGTTENVARLSLDTAHAPGERPFRVELDGQGLAPVSAPGMAKIHLSRVEGHWSVVGPASAAQKGPHRYGPFKEAFGHRMIFVYGTHGTAEENAWSFSKARMDAEAWRYRGNGSVDILSDLTFQPGEQRDRSVIIYGHADVNQAWASMLSECPVQIHRGQLRLGSRELRRDDLASFFVRPRPDSDVACVGVVAGTGLTGLRATERAPYFLAGVAYPDCVVFGADMPARGIDGVVAAGYFGLDWSVESGEFAWRDAAEVAGSAR